MTDEHRYPYFGEPPAREPRPAAEVPALRGKRVILSTARRLRLRHARGQPDPP